MSALDDLLSQGSGGPLDSLLSEGKAEQAKRPGFLKEVGRQIADVPLYHFPASVASALEGSDISKRGSISDRLIERSRKKAAEYSTEPGGQDPLLGGLIKREEIRGLGPSLGFSGVGALTGIGAGLPAAAVSTPLGGYAAGGAASYKAASNMAASQFLRDVRDKLEQDRGTPFSDAEWKSVAPQYESMASNYRTAEALPETLSNVAQLAILASPAGRFVPKPFVNLANKNLLTKTLTKGAGIAAAELPSEVVTQQFQQPEQVKAGLEPGPERSLTSLADWGQSLKEVAAPVLLQTAIMGGAGAAGVKAYRTLQDKAAPVEPEAPAKLPETGPMSRAVNTGIDSGATEVAPAGRLFPLTEAGAQSRAALLAGQGQAVRVIPHPEREGRFAVIPDELGTAVDDQGRIAALTKEAETIINAVPEGRPLTKGVTERLTAIDAEIAKLNEQEAKRAIPEQKADEGRIQRRAGQGNEVQGEAVGGRDAGHRQAAGPQAQAEAQGQGDRQGDVLAPTAIQTAIQKAQEQKRATQAPTTAPGAVQPAPVMAAVPSKVVQTQPEGPAAVATPSQAEVVDKGHPFPARPPSERWTSDRGAIPGEPSHLLDVVGGDLETAKAAIIEREVPGRGVLYDLTAPGGKNLGTFSTIEEAAKAGEAAFKPAQAQPAGSGETAPVAAPTGQAPVPGAQPLTPPAAIKGSPANVSHETLRQHVEAFLKRKPAASEMNNERTFKAARTKALAALAGENVNPNIFKMYAKALKDDQPSVDALTEIARILKNPVAEKATPVAETAKPENVPSSKEWSSALQRAAEFWGKADRGQRSYLAEKVGYGKAVFGKERKPLSLFSWENMPPNAQRALGQHYLNVPQNVPSKPLKSEEKQGDSAGRMSALKDPNIAALVRGMKDGIGADDRGGRVIVDMEGQNRAPGMGDVLGRTVWTGHPWWFQRPDQGLSAKMARHVIEKAVAGRKLGQREQRFMDYVLSMATEQNNEILEAEKQAGIDALSKSEQDEAISLADDAVSMLHADNWQGKTEAEREAEIDSIFGATSAETVAQGEGGGAQTGEDQARAEVAAEKPAAEEVAPPEPSAQPTETPAQAGVFDSEAFDKKRSDTIKASRAAGVVHLDRVPAAVESMRGREIFYVHDPKERGVIRTVDNRGNVYVYWSDKYSAEKELASESVEDNKAWLKSSKALPYMRVVRDGNTYVMQSSLGPSDLKDYAFADSVKQEAAPLALTGETPAEVKAKEKQIKRDKETPEQERARIKLESEQGAGAFSLQAEEKPQPMREAENLAKTDDLFAQPTVHPLTAQQIPADMMITLPVLVEETGETHDVEMSAREVFKEASRKAKRYQSLLDCVRA